MLGFLAVLVWGHRGVSVRFTERASIRITRKAIMRVRVPGKICINIRGIYSMLKFLYVDMHLAI